ncbi:MAG: cisplatin damage response ATP-dependent DNA ligase [Alphaproteobacteria bacterium]|nr:cisplatin damage response ATP-dependent DNA ligase [Alphaproteobacteria bacterium]
MQRFAALLDGLLYAPQRTVKLALLREHLATVPDPARGWALAALTGEVALPAAKPALVRALIAERMDPELFRLSYDFVGDLAETVALAWPAPPGDGGPVPDLPEVIERLAAASRTEVPRLLSTWLDALDATGRWALLKLITGGLRVGVSARLARQAVADWAERPVADIEEVWHSLTPPYLALFHWLDGQGSRPTAEDHPSFRPVMLAQPLEEADLAALTPSHYAAEWKWDGIRVQIVGRGAQRRVYSRTGDDISAAVPDLLSSLDSARVPFDGVLDGELLVGDSGPAGWSVRSFNDLQQRLNRKTVSARLQAAYPVFVRAYDLLVIGGEDLRAQPWQQRRAALEAWHAHHQLERIDLSHLVAFDSWEQLDLLRQEAGRSTNGAIEGVMLKRRDSPYLAGRPKGPWFKWKRGALTIDAVLMYAQRGHGKRSSFYSDYTFGCWQDGTLVPVGKAYSGFTDVELQRIDRFVRDNTTNRFGPVREVSPALVFEVAFDSVHPSPRHRSGLALRFPRIARIRWDKPAAEADQVSTLAALVG